MKRWIRKLLAGLLSFGMLLQVASPLSALAADGSGSDAPELTITLLRENEDTPYVGKIDQNTDSITLDGQSYQVDYQDGTYTLTGTMGTFYGSHIGDHLTISGPSDGVKPNLVVRKGENHEVANAYVKVENVNDFTSDSIAGITEFTCDGDINITADYYAVDFSFKVNSAHDVTVISEKATGQFVVGSAYINCTGKVTLRNEGQGALTHGSGITIRGAQDGVELYCKNATRMANGISIKNCKGDISIINENGPIGDPSVSNNLTVGGSGDTGVENVTIKANASGPVTNGKISVTAKTLNMQNDGGSIGNLTFTRTDTASDYYIVTGDSASSASQTKMEGEVYNPGTVSAKYLRISTDGFVPAPATPYGFSVNGTSVTAENAGATLPDGMTYDKAANKLTASKDITDDLTIAADNTNTTLDVELKSVNGSLTVGDYYNDTTRAQNLTINGTVTGKTYVCVTRDIVVNGTIASEQNNAREQNRLDTTTGEITVTSDGDVWGQNASVILKAADGPVTVSGNKPNEDLVGPNLTIWATKMKINNPDGKISAIVFVPQCSGDYYINESTEPAERRPWTLGREAIFSEAVDSKLVISQTKPEIHQHTLGDWEHDETHHWKTCSGCNEKVGKAEHDFNSDDICKECGYKKPAPTPDHHQHTASTEWKYDDTNHWHTCATCNEDVQLDKAAHSFGEDGVCECGYKDPDYKPEHQHIASTEWKYDDINHWHTCTTCEENVQLDKAPHNFGEDRKAEKCEDCGYANPDYVAPDPDDTGTVDSGSDAGGAVAAVLVGGAAVWGGYEIATRVILHNILPEGAAIPANRGQLALLVWNNAGRPAPVNEPAFADMDDADMAKAAQWCVEQGIMEAKTAETFKPESWTPKFKVIEVWNKAFPKQ